MEWDTGKTLAAIILVLLIAIIAWFMTRAGRERAAARYAEARRRDDVGAASGAGVVAARDAGAADAHGTAAGAGTVTGARGERAPAPLDVAVHRPAHDGAVPVSGSGDAHRPDAVDRDGITSVETDRPAHGGERFEPVGDTDPGPAAEALTEARAARLGVTADPAAPEIGADAGPGDAGAATGAGAASGTGAPATSGRASGARAPDGPAAFSAPNVELRETDGSLRSQGSGRDVADVAPGMPGAPGAPARGPAGPSGAPGGTVAAPSSGASSGTAADARPAASDAPAAFSAPNVELRETDGSLRSQGSGEDVADVAPGMPGAPSRGPAGPSGAPDGTPAPPAGAGADEGSGLSTAAKLAAGAAAVAAAAGTVAAARAATGSRRTDGDAPPTGSAPNRGGVDDVRPAAPDAPAAFSAPNVELKETDGSLRSQGSGEDVADVAPGMPGAPGAGPEGPGSAGAAASDRPRFDPTNDGHPNPRGPVGGAGGSFSDTRVGSTGGGGTPVDRLADDASAGDAPTLRTGTTSDRPSFDPANDGHPNPRGAAGGTGNAAGAGSGDDSGDWASRSAPDVTTPVDAGAALAAAAAGAATLVTTSSDAETTRGAGATGTESSDSTTWASRGAADDGAPNGGTGGGTGGGTSGGTSGERGGASTDAARDTTGPEVGGTSAARIHPADGDGLQGMGESVPLAHKDPSDDPSAPVPASVAAVRESHGEPPRINTVAGAAAAEAGPADDRPDDERANLPDPATAGGLDGLRPAPSTGASMRRTTAGLPDAGPALDGNYRVETGDAAHDVREMLKILNLRESDASRLGVSAEEYRSLREGRSDALPDDRLRALADRLAGMMV